MRSAERTEEETGHRASPATMRSAERTEEEAGGTAGRRVGGGVTDTPVPQWPQTRKIPITT